MRILISQEMFHFDIALEIRKEDNDRYYALKEFLMSAGRKSEKSAWALDFYVFLRAKIKR